MTYQAMYICKGDVVYGGKPRDTIAKCREEIPKMLEAHKDCNILKTIIIARDGRQVSIKEV